MWLLRARRITARSAISPPISVLTAASEEGESRAEQYCDQRLEPFHGMEILRDSLLQQQSDSARMPAVSLQAG